MALTWFWFRSGLRRRWRSWTVLSLLVGLAAGVVISAAAGARRTETAYDRFLEATDPFDVMVMAVPFPLDIDAVKRLPEVAVAVNVPYAFLDPAPGEPQRELSPLLVPDYRQSTQYRTKLVSGRRPHPDRADEASVNPVAAQVHGVEVGTVLRLQAWTPEAARALLEGDRQPPDGVIVEVKVVGVEASAGGLLPSENDEGSLALTPAFAREYGDQIGTVDLLMVQLRRGQADMAAFKAGVERIAGDHPPQYIDLGDDTAQVQRSIDVQASALRLFALLAGVAGVVVVGQALGRQTSTDAADQPTLAALGLTRPQRWLGAMLRPMVAAAAGAVLAAVVAYLGSPLMPFGLARLAEPDPGLAFDAPTVLVGVVVTIVLVLVTAAFPVWRATRLQAATRSLDADRPSRLAEGLARAGMRPSAVTGFRMAVEPPHGGSTVPTRAALSGTAISVLALAMAFTFGSSLHHLLGTPRLYGWQWDALVGSAFLEDVADEVGPALRDTEEVAGFSTIALAEVDIGGARTPTFGFHTDAEAIVPPILSGRAPGQADEIVLGSKTLRSVDRRVGQTVTVRVGDTVSELRIVGRGVLPALGSGDIAGLGEGALLTGEGLARLVPGAPRNMFAVRFRPGVSEADQQGVLERFQDMEVLRASPPKRVADFDRVDNMPVVLGGLLALIATATLVHTLVSAVRQRRHDLAILKTLGFVRGQVRGTVIWQAATLTLFALAVGIPLGVGAGRWSWRLFADRLGTVPEPVVPVLAVVLTIPVSLFIAASVAALPARAAARTRPALVLRSE